MTCARSRHVLKRLHWLAAAAGFSLATQMAYAQSAPPMPSGAALVDVIRALDKQHFDAFNACDLKTLEALYAPDAEFYHDLNGRVMDREQLLAAIQKNICGKVQRRATSPVEVQPLAGVGAVEIGAQCFYRTGKEACGQEGRFFMLWRYDKGVWRMTRVFSFEHRDLP